MGAPRLPRAAALGLAACHWIGDAEEAERLDGDRDGFPFAVDCNDDDAAVASLDVADAPGLACHTEVTGTLDGGGQDLAFTQCLHPTLAGDLVVLRSVEEIWRFGTATPAAVRITLEAGALVGDPALGPASGDNGDVLLVANRGTTCSVDRCAVALPPQPEAWKDGERANVAQSLEFFAEAFEPWAVVVSADGLAAGSAGYRLSVDCGG